MSEGEAISLKVVEEVADREEIDPAELQPPLHTVIDTEALDTLFRSTPTTARGDGTIEFEYRGYKIQVDGSGEVQIGEQLSFTERSEPCTQRAKDTVND
ncbi:HalOD1 output domain-containing protein [Natrinema amylolyticum]|uniref:HalOD1 output domain-containing protein n=1 Tax=Natrinema amylolyticum TaxID=2878679 RepID=UPI001CFB071D|nr:HalOD1 output domain-containing protein [Natrinema amylolyticum]